MPVEQTFQFSEREAKNIRRGAFLAPLLIVPLAAMYGLDSSKSQPSHFIITFLIGLVFGGIVFLIGNYGATRRIEQLATTSLSLGDEQLTWNSSFGPMPIDLSDVKSVTFFQRFGKVRTIAIVLQNARTIEIAGLDGMDRLAEDLQARMGNEKIRTRSWLQF